jgi:hypothetical protein
MTVRFGEPSGSSRASRPTGAYRGSWATLVAFSFGNETLTIRYGIAAALDERLSRSAIEPIIEAQAEFAESLMERLSALARAAPREVHSASPEGSIFSLRLT